MAESGSLEYLDHKCLEKLLGEIGELARAQSALGEGLKSECGAMKVVAQRLGEFDKVMRELRDMSESLRLGRRRKWSFPRLRWTGPVS